MFFKIGEITLVGVWTWFNVFPGPEPLRGPLQFVEMEFIYNGEGKTDQDVELETALALAFCSEGKRYNGTDEYIACLREQLDPEYSIWHSFRSVQQGE